jgi:predicted DNA-binding protein (UPF0278 family)
MSGDGRKREQNTGVGDGAVDFLTADIDELLGGKPQEKTAPDDDVIAKLREADRKAIHTFTLDSVPQRDSIGRRPWT